MKIKYAPLIIAFLFIVALYLFDFRNKECGECTKCHTLKPCMCEHMGNFKMKTMCEDGCHISYEGGYNHDNYDRYSRQQFY